MAAKGRNGSGTQGDAEANWDRPSLQDQLVELLREAWMGVAGLLVLLLPAAAAWQALRYAGAADAIAQGAAVAAFVGWLAFLGWQGKKKAALVRVLAALSMPFGEPRGL